MSDIVDKLRDGAREIENDGTPSQVGPTSDELVEAASEIERLRGWLRYYSQEADLAHQRLRSVFKVDGLSESLAEALFRIGYVATDPSGKGSQPADRSANA